MKDNALRIILFMYILSGGLAATDVLIAAPLGIQLQTMNGEPAGPQISTVYARMAEHDTSMRMMEVSGQMGAGDVLANAVRSVELGLEMAVEMFKLMAGLYAFDILTVFGIPHEITAIIVSAYVVLVGRALIGYMPAVAAGIRAVSSVGHTVLSGIRTLRP